MQILYSGLIIALLGAFCGAEEVSNDLENERVKRVAVDNFDVNFDSNSAPKKPSSRGRARANPLSDAADATYPTPVVIPAYSQATKFDKKAHSCLFYLESVTILVLNKATIGGVQQAYSVKLGAQNDSYGYSETGFFSCPSNSTYKDFSFKLNYIPKGKYEAKKNPTDSAVQFTFETPFTLDLTFTYASGFNLTSAVVDNLKVSPGGASDNFFSSDISASGNAINVIPAAIRAYKGYSYGCSATPALLFSPKDNDKILLGIILNNVQIQAYGIDVNPNVPGSLPHFGGPVTDCVPTFSQGTWMGIITTLILISVLAFAFLMLNSVQTMDRFDDPKQKQIVINFKE